MAKLTATGNLGADAELKVTPSGRPVLNFSVADSKSKPDGNGGWEKISEQWLNCAIWGDLAEYYDGKLTKGARVEIWGDFYSRKYEGANGPSVSLDVNVKGVDVLPTKKRDNNSGGDWGGSNNSGGGQGWNTGADQSEAPF